MNLVQFRWVEISLRTLFANSALLNLGSFKVYSLFSYQGSKFNRKLNSSVDRAFLFSATAYTVYRLSSHLSTTFYFFLPAFLSDVSVWRFRLAHPLGVFAMQSACLYYHLYFGMSTQFCRNQKRKFSVENGANCMYNNIYYDVCVKNLKEKYWATNYTKRDWVNDFCTISFCVICHQSI